MLAMSREDAFVAFFRQLSDLVLQPGDFDFMEAGVRMSCEGVNCTISWPATSASCPWPTHFAPFLDRTIRKAMRVREVSRSPELSAMPSSACRTRCA